GGGGKGGGREEKKERRGARAGTRMQYAFCPVRLERSVAFPKDHVLVVATSGVAAEKIGAARDRYNRLSTMAREILEQWQSVTGVRYPSLASAIAASPDAADRIRGLLRAQRLTRFEHFLLESNELVPGAADALARDDVASLGSIVERSQRAAEELLGNQTPETSFLARSGRELGAVAASAFGAGFGGSVWALVSDADAGVFQSRWASAYAAHFPVAARRSEMFLTHGGPGVVELG
ncbi:MAG: galactokinase family protein, partial [Gemmatimonadaceae bacterium]